MYGIDHAKSVQRKGGLQVCGGGVVHKHLLEKRLKTVGEKP
jgi:hypothetical protein